MNNPEGRGELLRVLARSFASLPLHLAHDRDSRAFRQAAFLLHQVGFSLARIDDLAREYVLRRAHGLLH